MATILIFGGSGLLGKTLEIYLKNKNNAVSTPTRDEVPLADPNRYLDIATYIDNIHPSIIINCAGVLPQEARVNPIQAYLVNTIFPQLLEQICLTKDIKLLHFSTNCVFKGKMGIEDQWYRGTDIPDETDFYGRSKALGELKNSTTIRLSFVGVSSRPNDTGLLEWFLRNSSLSVNGYNVMWNGISTLDVAENIEKLLSLPPKLYHVATITPISKYDLLLLAKKIFEKNVNILPAIGGGDPKLLYPDIIIDSGWEEKMIKLKNYREKYCI